MYRLMLCLGLVVTLSACLGGGRAAAPAAEGALRGAGPIYSSAVLDPARLEGTWQEVAGLLPQGASCARGGGMRVSQAGQRVDYRLCPGGRALQGSGPLGQSGPGRLSLPGLDQPVWVLWVDADYRTLVLGTPSGAFGMVLNRGGALPADRETALRDILVWNRYDLARYTRF